MNKKPFGSNLNFYDGEWIFPLGLLAVAMLFGDFIWVKTILIIMYFIACLHTVNEHKIAFGNKNIGMRYFYAFLGLLSSVVFFALPLIYMLISYAMCSSQLKKDEEEGLLVNKRKTYVTIMAILVFAVGVHAWQGFLMVNDLMAIQAEQLQTNRAGTISQ